MLNGGDALAINAEIEPIETDLIAMVVHDNWVYQAADLPAHRFANDACAFVWERFGEILGSGQQISPMTLKAQFGVERGQEVARIADARLSRPIEDGEIEGSYAYQYRVNAINEHWMRRQAIQAGEELADSLKNPDVNATHAITETLAYLTERLISEEWKASEDVHAEAVKAQSRKLACYSTDIQGLDRVMYGGLFAGRLYGIGGRYKSGKSFLLTTISYNVQCPHGYLTLESSRVELWNRMLARAMGVNVLQFLRPENQANPAFIERMNRAAEEIGNRIYMKSSPRIDPDGMQAAIEQLVVKHKVKGVIVDYLQLVSASNRAAGPVLHYEEVAQRLAEIAKDMGIWVVVAAQLNAEGGIRWGDALLNACDMTLAIHPFEHDRNLSWVEMKASRYTEMQNFGNDGAPAMVLNTGAGPYFREI